MPGSGKIKKHMPLAGVRPGDEGVAARVIVLRALPGSAKTGYPAVVADESGAMHTTLWGPAGAAVRGGDILEVSNASAQQFKGQLQLMLGKASVSRVGTFSMLFSEANLSSQ